MYALFTALGVGFGLVASRFTPPDSVPPRIRAYLRVGALLGAVIGAHLLELPADLLGWSAAVPGHPGTPLLGRTLLGGVLGGWLGVEVTKRVLGFSGATGDRFAAPLAIALAFGRLGCTVTGCCPGIPLAASSRWARLSMVYDSPPRFPATLIEAYFHAVSALVLVYLGRQGVFRGRLFSGYAAALALERFALETVRDNPRLALGLTYYQWLCIPLFAAGIVTCGVRSWRPPKPSSSERDVPKGSPPLERQRSNSLSPQ